MIVLHSSPQLTLPTQTSTRFRHPQFPSTAAARTKPAGPLIGFCMASGPGAQRLPPVAVQPSSSGDFSPTTIGELLSEVSVFKASGEAAVFKDLWDQNGGMAVVALLRHFGCPCCWELASELKEAKSKFESAGVKLIAIGVGEPKKALLFAERLPFPVDCLYADPGRKAYDVLGLYYGFGRTFFNPASVIIFSLFRFCFRTGISIFD
ncbi:Thioredoxin-like protein AAED1, chloroplastic [Linum grandiflorum]